LGKLAFFPWLDVKASFDCGDFRVVRYRRGEAPGANAEEQAAIDKLLAPYHDAHGDSVSRATILQHVGQASPTDAVDETYHLDLFVFADLLAFTGLSTRRFFSPFGYSNRDHYRLILQQFTEPGRGVLITTRRRDGSTDAFFTGDVYKLQRPNHVGHVQLEADQDFLRALVAAMAHPDWPRVYQAIILFNEANTDRIEMPIGTELVLTYAAIEQGLGMAGAPTRDVAAAFAEVLQPYDPLPTEDWAVPEGNPRAEKLLQKSASLRAAWLQDLANSRGSLAHGHALETYPACWQPHEHLLLGAHAVPLLVKRRLQDMIGYELSAKDRGSIDALEPLINARHFESSDNDEDDSDQGWSKILDRHRMRVWVRDAADKFFPEDTAAS
jgi:hypothetical protein